MTKIICYFIIILGIGNVHGAYAQKAEAETEFKYTKNSDNSRTLTYTVKSKSGTASAVPVRDVNIIFMNGSDNLATVKTDAQGVATCVIPASKKLTWQDNGKLKFSATIGTNALVETGSKEVSLTDIEIQMDFKIEDSVKKVYFKAFELGPNEEKKPVSKTDIFFYIPRMFSLYKVADGSLGEDGTGEIEFPSDLPGDSLGNLTIMARIEESENYANVEKQEKIAWGKPVNYHFPKFQRALWTAVAPTWMIITLTILLLGVWAHYAFVIFNLWKIKQESIRK
jgi:hypothetical protein